MITRQTGGGARQKAWDLLRAKDYQSTKSLADAIGCAAAGLRGYVAALVDHGYVQRLDDGTLRLTRVTGPRAPSWNVHSGDFRDWNIEPGMTGSELQALIRATGLSDAAWLRSHGLPPENSTRLRQMMNGQRPVSDAIATLARAMRS